MFSSEGCSLPVGRLCMGIPIKLHWTFFMLLALELIDAIFRVQLFSFTMLIVVLYGPILLITIVVHELGHAWMNKKYGGSVEKIVLWPLGGFVVLGRTDGGIMEDFWVALAGPLTHIPMTAIWFGLYCITASPQSLDGAMNYSELDSVKGWSAGLFESAISLNVVLFVFNLFIPAYPLDGGRCLAALLVRGGVEVPRAAIVTSVTAMILAGLMIAYGVFTLIVKKFGGVMFILIGALTLYMSHALFRMTRAGKVYEHPLFAKECYRQASSSSSGSGNSAPNPAPAADTAAPGTSQANTVSTAQSSNNQNQEVEMGNYNGAPPKGDSNSSHAWTNTQQQQPSPHNAAAGSNVGDRLRSGMGRMFRSEPKANTSTPDLTI